MSITSITLQQALTGSGSSRSHTRHSRFHTPKESADKSPCPKPATPKRRIYFSEESGVDAYRDPPGNNLSQDQYMALVLIAMWMARQNTVSSTGSKTSAKAQRLKMRREAAEHGNAVINNEMGFAILRQSLFPQEDATRLWKKVMALNRILRREDLDPDVKDCAYCHCSSKTPSTDAGVRALQLYVHRLMMKCPSRSEFMDPNADHIWFPEFNSDN